MPNKEKITILDSPIKIGGDPEIGLMVNGDYVSAREWVPSFETSFGRDGHQQTCELRPIPDADPKIAALNLRTVIFHGYNYMNVISNYSKKIEFACQDERQAFGGHIHIDIPSEYTYSDSLLRLRRIVDNFLGLPERNINEPYNLRGRGSYANFKNMRRKRWGVEYRTTSANIISNKYTLEIFYAMAKLLTVMHIKGAIVNYNNKTDGKFDIVKFNLNMKKLQKKIDKKADPYYYNVIDKYMDVINLGEYYKFDTLDLHTGWSIKDREIQNKKVSIGTAGSDINDYGFIYNVADKLEHNLSEFNFNKDYKFVLLHKNFDYYLVRDKADGYRSYSYINQVIPVCIDSDRLMYALDHEYHSSFNTEDDLKYNDIYTVIENTIKEVQNDEQANLF